MTTHVRRLKARARGPAGVGLPAREQLGEALDAAVHAALAARGLPADTEVVVRHASVRVRVRGHATEADIAAGWGRAMAGVLERRLERVAVGAWDETAAVFVDRGAAAWEWLALAAAATEAPGGAVVWWERIFGPNPSAASVLAEELEARPERVRAGLVELIRARPAGAARLLDTLDADALVARLVGAEGAARALLGYTNAAPRVANAAWPTARAAASRDGTRRLLDVLAGESPLRNVGVVGEEAGSADAEGAHERAEGDWTSQGRERQGADEAAPAGEALDETTETDLPDVTHGSNHDANAEPTPLTHPATHAPIRPPTHPAIHPTAPAIHPVIQPTSAPIHPDTPAVIHTGPQPDGPSPLRLGPPVQEPEHAVGAGGLLFLLRWLARSVPATSADLQFALARVLLHDLCGGLPEGARRRALAGETPLVAVFAGYESLSADEWVSPPTADERDRVAPLLAALDAALPEGLGAAAHGPDWLLRGAPLPPALARVGFLVLRPGRITLTRTHARLTLPMRFVDFDLRRAGWDLDPGWVPWIGRVVRFEYEEDRR